MAWNANLEEGSPAHTFASEDSDVIRSVAGPGSGKSFAIGRRIARLIEDGCAPRDILAITFTRTAAKDLRTDISKLDVEGSDQVAARTVHSHALSILMKENVIEATGRTPRMILDHELEPALRDLDRPEFGDVRAKKRLLDEYLAVWATLQTDEPAYVPDDDQRAFEDALIEWMIAHEGMHVGEVIPVAIRYLRNNPACESIGEYRHIFVDEYQDLNRAEQEFIRRIRGDACLTIVGDDDQSIYGFKHAHPDGIRQLNQLHGEFSDVPFDVCRRCPSLVTKVASDLIGQNTNRTLGELRPFEENPEGRIDIIQWRSNQEEIDGLADIILAEVEQGHVQPQDILVLTPRRLTGYAIRDALADRMVKAKSYFRESSISNDFARIAYDLILLACVPEDAVALRFLLGVGASGNSYRHKQYRKIRERAQQDGSSVREVCDRVSAGDISIVHTKQIIEKYEWVQERLSEVRQRLQDNPENLFLDLFEGSQEEIEAVAELKSIYELVCESVAQAHEGEEISNDQWKADFISRFQREVSHPEIPEEIDHVRIMSLHASKGLSSPLVIIAGAIDETIPGKAVTPEEIEEQRRLFYVAVTRCKATRDYDGRLIVSSFLRVPVAIAYLMGIPTKGTGNRIVHATRFLNELGTQAPAPVAGASLL
jgi:DNA helicase-2/ATP-dependent DNA helicase PcrA